MGSYIIFIFVLIPFLLIPIAIILDNLLKDYKFKNKLINSILIIVAFFGNPFSIIISYFIVSFLFGVLNQYVLFEYVKIIQYILFFSIILILMIFRYLFWSKETNNYKSYSSLLIFSKRYIIQSIYLLYYTYHFIFSGFKAYDFELGLMFYYFELPSMIISGFIVTIYVYYKNDKKTIGENNGR